jgi:hypothetical protein
MRQSAEGLYRWELPELPKVPKSPKLKKRMGRALPRWILIFSGGQVC